MRRLHRVMVKFRGKWIRGKSDNGSVAMDDAHKDAALKSARRRGQAAYSMPIEGTESIADRIVAEARKHLGTKETPAGSNSGPKIDRWLRRCDYPWAGPWCAAYASCMVLDGGGTLPGNPSASCKQLRRDAIAKGRWSQVPRKGYIGIIAGDVHAVIIEEVYNDRVRDISGNTSSSDGTSYNGGCVAEHTHKRAAFSGYIATW